MINHNNLNKAEELLESNGWKVLGYNVSDTYIKIIAEKRKGHSTEFKTLEQIRKMGKQNW
jgi:hypothetical protein